MMEGKWFKIWHEDKTSILATMYENLAADLDAGYNPFGKCISDQKQKIKEYTQEFDAEMQRFREKNNQQIEHWCYYDLKRRGSIE